MQSFEQVKMSEEFKGHSEHIKSNVNLLIVLLGFVYSLGSFPIWVHSVIPRPSCSERMPICLPFLAHFELRGQLDCNL